MCGIWGITNSKISSKPDEALVHTMNEALRHRGPDDRGYYQDEEITLGVTRLAVIDLKTGHQPIHNEDQTVWLIFNGEIYNFQLLRKELIEKGHKFYTQTDTEVIVHLYEEEEEDFIRRLNGMFAFALWDNRKRKLLLARDPFGIKPLLYTIENNELCFASEIRALFTLTNISKEIDWNTLDDYFSFYYTCSPSTMFKEIKKLPPACLMIYENGKIRKERYWQLNYTAQATYNERHYCEMIVDLLRQAVKRQLVSDVPLGLFLSGGLDSPSILAIMREATDVPVKTFSIVFEERSFNEAREIRQIVNLFQTEHHELLVKADVIPEFLPQILDCLGEPTGDWTAALELYLAKFAKKAVTVVISGVGGDEIFAGYPTITANKLAAAYQKTPLWLREKIIRRFIERLPVSMSYLSLDYKLKRFVRGANLPPERSYFSWKETFSEQEKKSLYCPDLQDKLREFEPFSVFEYYLEDLDNDTELINRLLYLDLRVFLGGCVLPHIDGAAMSNSIEARIPLLDLPLVEFAATIPPELKHRRFTTKYIFRKALRDLLPREIRGKKKRGFVCPVSLWIQNGLKGWVEEVLFQSKIKEAGLFSEEYLKSLLHEHSTNRADNGRKISALVSFALWYTRYF
jgi:asparagine synthase (glutamine-hydrolysing)